VRQVLREQQARDMDAEIDRHRKMNTEGGDSETCLEPVPQGSAQSVIARERIREWDRERVSETEWRKRDSQRGRRRERGQDRTGER
jgi:hypothetical protein